MVTRRVTILCEAQAYKRFALDHHPSGDYGFPSGNDQGNPKGYIQGHLKSSILTALARAFKKRRGTNARIRRVEQYAPKGNRLRIGN